MSHELPPKRRFAMLARLLRALRPPRTSVYTRPALSEANLPRLQGPTRIVRDANGVPHIYAEREADLFAVLGFLQAADRFPSIDVIRHLGAGRMCELFGDLPAPTDAGLISGKRLRDLDAFVRPLDFEGQCQRDCARLGEHALECLQGFADGVNAALRAMNGDYPAEYLLLGRVREWTAGDCLLAARTCAFTVSLTAFDNELVFDAVRGRLGDEAARRLYPEAPWAATPTTYQPCEGPTPEAPLHAPGGGSNNWAVAPSLSASGAPILANDPHVPLVPVPTFWYHAHLEGPNFRVQGGALPGCPVFPLGHNGSFAWGVTTGYRDGWDLYRVRRLPEDPTRYRTVAGTGDITPRRVLQYARFGRAFLIEWEDCGHGIIFPGWRHHDGTDLAVRHVPADMSRYFQGSLALLAAHTVAEHRDALREINEGPFDFNHVYAHKDGTIAWELYGRLPKRSADGLFVRDADDPAAQWDGYVAFGDMPKIVDPPRGYVASANSIVDPGHFAPIASRPHFEPRFRHERIESLLRSTTSHSTDTFAEIQGDLGTDYALPARDGILGLLEDARTPLSEGASAAVVLLREWDGAFPCASAAAPVFFFTLQKLVRLVAKALLGEALGARYAEGRHALPRLQRMLTDHGDPLRADVERAAGRPLAALVAEALEAAVARVAALAGADPSGWRWGAVQRARLGTLLSFLPVVGRRFVAVDTEYPGSDYTVSMSRALDVGGRLHTFVGASSRFICDLSKPEEALFAHSSGHSGDPASVLFANLSPGWRKHEYFRSALWASDEVPEVVERVVVGEPHTAS